VAPTSQIHDFHPSIAASGLYWVVPVPVGGVELDGDGKSVTLAMRDVAVIDQPRWPALDASATPAKMSFKMVWKSTGEHVLYEDAARQFRFEGTRAVCQMEAQVEVPSIGFSWKSDPLASASAAFAIVGNETNGRYYG
jgi:hypothetical protein